MLLLPLLLQLFFLLLLLVHALDRDETRPPTMVYTTHFSLLLDSVTHKAKKNVLTADSLFDLLSPLIQNYKSIKLIRFLSTDAWSRLFSSVLPYSPALLQQRMSCWLYGDAVISAVMRMCGYICGWHVRTVRELWEVCCSKNFLFYAIAQGSGNSFMCH